MTKHRPQTPIRKSARLEAIQLLERRADFSSQTIHQYPFPSLSTSSTHSSVHPLFVLMLPLKLIVRKCLQGLSTCEKPSGLEQRLGQKRKRSQGNEDLVPQTEDQPIDLERKTFTRENGEYHQLPSPSTSNSHRQSYGKERRRAVSLPSLSKKSNNRYLKRRKAVQQSPQQDTSTSSPIFGRPEEGPKASESEEKEKDDPISYWAVHLTWPDNFAEPRAMSSSNKTNKRQRTTDNSQSVKEGKSWTYAQSRRNGDVPGQYTKAYENYIFTTGLDMNEYKGRKFVSSESLETCKVLQTITCKTISHTIYSSEETVKVVEFCRNRNEATVARNVTSLILPPIISFSLKDGGKQFEHLTDEVDTMWRESWVLAGPRPKPDLAVGFVSSAFTIEENQKLTYYTSFENITRPTDNLSFPFLISEIKCGNEGLDFADRQNMHSCSVAVKAILKLEQKADQYREEKQFESLLGKILVYSISHDQKGARVYGHYALVEGENWTYYRHYIGGFDIGHKEKDLLALHNFARNVLTMYAPKLLKQLQKAIAALPVSSPLPVSADTMNLEGDSQQSSQQPSQSRNTEGFLTPAVPASTQKLLNDQKEQVENLLQQMERQREEIERQRNESKEKEERQREEIERQRKEKDELMERFKEFMGIHNQKNS